LAGKKKTERKLGDKKISMLLHLASGVILLREVGLEILGREVSKGVEQGQRNYHLRGEERLPLWEAKRQRLKQRKRKHWQRKGKRLEEL